jgi:hypothetical protein
VFDDVFAQLADALAAATCRRVPTPWATASSRARSSRPTTWMRCARPRWSCCTACCFCSTPKTATCCRCTTRATPPTACAASARKCATRWTPGRRFPARCRASGWRCKACLADRQGRRRHRHAGLQRRPVQPRRSPLLERTDVPDKVMAPIIDALSRRTEDLLRGWINYRDLSVAHLGGIYERLLEYSLVHEVQAKRRLQGQARGQPHRGQPASFARKVSGSYYTHDDLVRLVLRESVGLLARERRPRSSSAVAGWKKRATLSSGLAQPGDPDAAGRARPGQPASGTEDLRPGHGQRPLSGGAGRRAGRPRARSHDQRHALVNAQPWAAHLAESRPPLAKPGAGAHQPDPPRHQDHAPRARLGGDRCAAGRPPHRAPHDPEENHLRRGQEPHGRGAGQDRAVAAHLHRRRAAVLPGPPPARPATACTASACRGAARPAAPGRAAAANRVATAWRWPAAQLPRWPT